MPLAVIADVTDQLQRVKDADLPMLQDHLDSAINLITGMCVPLQPATVTDLLDGGQPSVLLTAYPLNAVTSVAILSPSGSEPVLEAGGSTGLSDGWRVDLLAGVLHRVGWRAWPMGWGNVQVVYTVGPSAVPAEVTRAVVLLTEHLWQFRKIAHQPATPGNDPQGYSLPYAIPNKVIELIREYLKPPRVG